jgi:anti-sigma regulatory factor (Ser/Thr protein kinase)
MSDHLTLQIKNSFAAVHSANEAASRWLTERGAPAEIQNFANLAIEEFATNSIKYGYDDTKEHLIEVNLSLSSGELVLVITDDGHAFNPLEAPEPKVNVPVEERPVGGLGIYLARKMSDQMDYAREGGKNRLTLHKSLHKPGNQ